MWDQLCDILAYCSPIGNNTSPCMFFDYRTRMWLTPSLTYAWFTLAMGAVRQLRLLFSVRVFRHLIWLRRMGLHCIRLSCDLCMNYWETDRDKYVRKLRGDCKSSHSLRKISPGSFFATTLPKNRVFASRSSRGLNKCPCEEWNNARTICLRTTGLRVLTLVQRFFLYKIVESAEPVTPYDDRTDVATCTRRPHVNGDTGILRAP